MVLLLGHPIYDKTTSSYVELLELEPFDPQIVDPA